MFFLVSQPPGFGMTTYTGTNGYFNSHSGYLQQLYPPGIQTRFVVVVPKGQCAQISIDVTNPQLFRLRPYDFAVIFDGASAQQLSKPCVFASYLALGQSKYTFTDSYSLSEHTVDWNTLGSDCGHLLSLEILSWDILRDGSFP